MRFFLGYGLIFFFQHVLTIVGVTAIMLWTDWRLALVALAITPFVVALAYRYSKVSHPVLRDVQQKMADVATVAEENIVGVHVVKSFAQEEQEQAKFQQRSEGGLRADGRSRTGSARSTCRCSASSRCSRRPRSSSSAAGWSRTGA